MCAVPVQYMLVVLLTGVATPVTSVRRVVGAGWPRWPQMHFIRTRTRCRRARDSSYAGGYLDVGLGFRVNAVSSQVHLAGAAPGEDRERGRQANLFIGTNGLVNLNYARSGEDDDRAQSCSWDVAQSMVLASAPNNGDSKHSDKSAEVKVRMSVARAVGHVFTSGDRKDSDRYGACMWLTCE